MGTTSSRPTLNLDDDERDELHLLLAGALGSGRYGAAPTDPVLTLPEDLIARLETDATLILTDEEGAPMARVQVEELVTTHPDGQQRITGSVQELEGVAYTGMQAAVATPGQRDSVWVLTGALCQSVVDDLASRSPSTILVAAPVVADDGTRRSAVVTAASHYLSPHHRIEFVPISRRVAEDPTLFHHVLAAYGASDEDVLPRGGPALRADTGHDRGAVIFFTGLSGSGKSTLAKQLANRLRTQGRTVSLLDGDVVRRHLTAGLGFSREDREKNVRRVGWVAAQIAHHGGLALCALIAPYESTREEVRSMCAEADCDFVLVHMATSLDECEARDRKGLYAAARRGEIEDFTGVNAPYEVPSEADLRVQPTLRSVAESVEDVLDLLRRREVVDLAQDEPC